MYPVGNKSATEIPVASLGPRLEATNVKTTFVPIFGAATFTVLVILRSVCLIGIGVTEATSLLAIGSFSNPLIFAVLVYEPLGFTVATIVNVLETPLAILPTAHIPVLLV